MRNTRTTDLQIALQAQSSTYEHQKKGRAGKKQFMFRSGPSVVLSSCDERVCTAVTPRLRSLLISLLIRSSTVRFLLCGSEFPEVPEVPEVQKSSRTYTALLGGAVLGLLSLSLPLAPVAGHTLGRTVFSLTTGTASLFEFFLFPSLNCVM